MHGANRNFMHAFAFYRYERIGLNLSCRSCLRREIAAQRIGIGRPCIMSQPRAFVRRAIGAQSYEIIDRALHAARDREQVRQIWKYRSASADRQAEAP